MAHNETEFAAPAIDYDVQAPSLGEEEKKIRTHHFLCEMYQLLAVPRQNNKHKVLRTETKQKNRQEPFPSTNQEMLQSTRSPFFSKFRRHGHMFKTDEDKTGHSVQGRM